MASATSSTFESGTTPFTTKLLSEVLTLPPFWLLSDVEEDSVKLLVLLFRELFALRSFEPEKLLGVPSLSNIQDTLSLAFAFVSGVDEDIDIEDDIIKVSR